uniref:Uncharacterized protein n=1 Tax=Anguilla anguilla TaxID=7936 RepID=A0A0E9PHN3_ANGAN
MLKRKLPQAAAKKKLLNLILSAPPPHI